MRYQRLWRCRLCHGIVRSEWLEGDGETEVARHCLAPDEVIKTAETGGTGSYYPLQPHSCPHGGLGVADFIGVQTEGVVDAVRKAGEEPR